MGPRRYRRGSLAWAVATSMFSCAGFNGAATLPSRIVYVRGGRYPFALLLQWGRDVTVADRDDIVEAIMNARTIASMGPRRYRRGSSPSLSFPGRSRPLQWGRDVTVADRRMVIHRLHRTRLASMGPRRYRRGSMISSSSAGASPALQWGRDVTVADRRMAASFSRRNAMLQWGRDVTVADRALTSSNNNTGIGFNGAATLPSRIGYPRRLIRRTASSLQWGRDVTVADRSPPTTLNGITQQLQWGRDVTVADRHRAGCDAAGLWKASMGPRRYRRGSFLRESALLGIVEASMGPRRYRRGSSTAAPVANSKVRLQWGRDVTVADRARAISG